MELYSSIIKKFLIFSQKKVFLIFQEVELSHILGNTNPEKLSCIFLQKKKKNSENRNPEKILYISGNGSFLHLRK